MIYPIVYLLIGVIVGLVLNMIRVHYETGLTIFEVVFYGLAWPVSVISIGYRYYHYFRLKQLCDRVDKLGKR